MLANWFAPDGTGRFRLDMWRATRDELEGAGVLPDSIHVAGLCTKTHADVFHSYRADGEGAGRMAAVIRAGMP
jgi:copper oxidase (laccase) domain-containing protein